MTTFAPTLQVDPGLLHHGEMPVDSTVYLGPASPHLVLTGSCSWKLETVSPLMTNFLFSALIIPRNAMGGILLKRADHVVEVIEATLPELKQP